MEQDFDFEKMRKRMPYNVPDGMFDEMRDRVWLKLKEEQKKRHRRMYRLVTGSVLAVAASVILLFTLFLNKPSTVAGKDLQAIDQAYNNLSPEDQTYLMEAYQNDVFLTENTNNSVNN